MLGLHVPGGGGDHEDTRVTAEVSVARPSYVKVSENGLHTSNFTDLKTVGASHSCNSYEDFANGHQKQAMARIIKFLSPNNKTELRPFDTMIQQERFP
jgi:hypothetical protein